MIILLSGISCSGKSTLSKHLLQVFDQPFVYHNFDFLAPSLLPHTDSFEPISDLETRTCPRKIDFELFKRINISGINLIDATYGLIPILDQAGCNIIVDTILMDEVLEKIYSSLSYSKSEIYIVGIHCSREEIERRVLKRKNRKIENVRKQFNSSFHKSKKYDFEVDTSKIVVMHPGSVNK